VRLVNIISYAIYYSLKPLKATTTGFHKLAAGISTLYQLVHLDHRFYLSTCGGQTVVDWLLFMQVSLKCISHMLCIIY